MSAHSSMWYFLSLPWGLPSVTLLEPWLPSQGWASLRALREPASHVDGPLFTRKTLLWGRGASWRESTSLSPQAPEYRGHRAPCVSLEGAGGQRICKGIFSVGVEILWKGSLDFSGVRSHPPLGITPTASPLPPPPPSWLFCPTMSKQGRGRTGFRVTAGVLCQGSSGPSWRTLAGGQGAQEP